jgi:hypothetical protein
MKSMSRIKAYVCAALLTPLHALAQQVSYHGTWWATFPGSEARLHLLITQRERAISVSWSTRGQVDNSWSKYSVTALPTEASTYVGPLYQNRVMQIESSAGVKGASHPVIRLQRERKPMGTATLVFVDENNGNLTYGGTNYQISRSEQSTQ